MCINYDWNARGWVMQTSHIMDIADEVPLFIAAHTQIYSLYNDNNITIRTVNINNF